MARSSFGSGLEDDDDNIIEAVSEPSSEPVQAARSAEKIFAKPSPAEHRQPFAWSFASQVGGMPLELGTHAKATIVDHGDSEWLLTLDQSGQLHAALVEKNAEVRTVEHLCPVFASQKWSAFDARTCDQTGQILWVGIDRGTGALHATVHLELALKGEITHPDLFGHASDLDLPGNPQRVLSIQLTDWFGRKRLDLVLLVKPERDGGGPSVQVMERKSDNFLEGYLPAQLANPEADRLLAKDSDGRLLLVSWSAPGADQWLHLSGDGSMHLLGNFGGILPPGVGRSKPLLNDNSGKATTIVQGAASVAWAKAYLDKPGRLVVVDKIGRVSVSEADSRDQSGDFQTILSKLSGELHFGPDAVATAADWNHDGRIDVIVGHTNGSLTRYAGIGSDPDRPESAGPERLESGGDPFTVPSQDRRRGSSQQESGQTARYSCPVLADWTAHERLDAIVTDNRGAVWYMRNNGNKFQPRLDFADRVSSEGRPLFVAPRSQVAMGYWSGAAEPDLIAFDTDGELAYWPRRLKLDLQERIKITDVRKNTIRLGGTGDRAGLVHLWAGAWTAPGTVELIISVPKFAISRVADWLEIPFEKPLEDFPLFWILQKSEDGDVTTKPIRTADAGLIHKQMAPESRSFSLCPITYGGRTEPDLLVVPEQGQAILWPRESLRWD